MSAASYDAYREDVVGRADVPDTPELVNYYKELAQLKTAALWTVANKIEPWQPKSDSVPVLWRYQDLREHVLRSVSLVSPEKAGRRVVYLDNPGRRDVAAAVGWLYSGLQVMHPGEAASAHWHSTSGPRGVHHRQRPQADTGRQRLRHHAQWLLARTRRGVRRLALHLAGWFGHSVGQCVGSRLLRRTPGHAPDGGTPRE